MPRWQVQLDVVEGVVVQCSDTPTFQLEQPGGLASMAGRAWGNRLDWRCASFDASAWRQNSDFTYT